MLLTEKGTQLVTHADLEQIPTPPATDTWHPIPHHRVLAMALESLERDMPPRLLLIGRSPGSDMVDPSLEQDLAGC